MQKFKSNPFGVLEFLHWNHAWNNYKYPSEKDLIKEISLMKNAGVGIVRMDFLWEDIEPRKSEFDFTKYDKIVNLLCQKNIAILAILNYNVSWAAPGAKWNTAPKNNELFVNYAVKLIQHYKGKIKYWEIWNEPDSATYWEPQDGLKSYCRLLKEVYIAAKKVNPECKILNGGLANSLGSINRLYDNGAGGYFDILNIHFFETPLTANSIKAVTAYPKLAYKIMLRNGDGNKMIWITEIGCPGIKNTIKTKNWWMGKNPDELEQAQWVTKVYSELLKNNKIEKIFWAFFRDCNNHWGTGVDYFGLVRWDFSKKPSFNAYKKCFNNWNQN